MSDFTAKIKSKFHQWDENSDRRLSREEFRKLMNAISPDLPLEEIDAVFAAVDKDGSKFIDPHELIDWAFADFVTLRITVVRANDLFNANWIQRVDPCVIVTLKTEDSSRSTRGETHAADGVNADFGEEVLEVPCHARHVAKGDTLEITVVDENLFKDSHIGTASLNLATLACRPGLEESLDLCLYRKGTDSAGRLVVRFHVPEALKVAALALQPVERNWPLQLIPAKIHKNAATGFVTHLHEGKFAFQDYLAYEVALSPDLIQDCFADKYQHDFDEKHAKIFADTATGLAVRTFLCGQRALLFADGPRSSWSTVHGGDDFLDLIGNGVCDGTSRVYTYVLLDTGLYFCETGVVRSKDIVSKHALLANCEQSVRFAGSFRICMAGGTHILVIDNDSGTYRPRYEDGSCLQRLLQRSFGDLEVRVLDSQGEQPKDTLSWTGPDETGDEKVYKGRYRWQPYAGPEKPGP